MLARVMPHLKVGALSVGWRGRGKGRQVEFYLSLERTASLSNTTPLSLSLTKSESFGAQPGGSRTRARGTRRPTCLCGVWRCVSKRAHTHAVREAVWWQPMRRHVCALRGGERRERGRLFPTQRCGGGGEGAARARLERPPFLHGPTRALACVTTHTLTGRVDSLRSRTCAWRRATRDSGDEKKGEKKLCPFDTPDSNLFAALSPHAWGHTCCLSITHHSHRHSRLPQRGEEGDLGRVLTDAAPARGAGRFGSRQESGRPGHHPRVRRGEALPPCAGPHTAPGGPSVDPPRRCGRCARRVGVPRPRPRAARVWVDAKS